MQKIILLFFLLAAVPGLAKVDLDGIPDWDYQPGQIVKETKAAITKFKARIAKIRNTPVNDRTFDNTSLALETAFADYAQQALPLGFINQVSPKDSIRNDSSDAQKLMAVFEVDIFSDVKLYGALKDQVPRTPAEKRLFQSQIQKFESSGSTLSPEKREKFVTLSKKLGLLQQKFNADLNGDATSFVFSETDLDGLSADQISKLRKEDDPSGQVTVTTKRPDYEMVVEYAKNPEVRKKILLAYNSIVPSNGPLLQEAIEIRKEIAGVMGYPSWAAFVLHDKLAKDPKTVITYLDEIKNGLAEIQKQELKEILDEKKLVDPKATELTAWDAPYFARILGEKKFGFDPEKVADYYPAQKVVDGIFDIYSGLLGVSFEEVTGAPVWAPGVKLYNVKNPKTGQVIARYYTDLVPRDGKYPHAQAVELKKGRRIKNKYVVPIAAIVANFASPSEGKPARLTIEQITTFFHEFGHIMHQILTEAPYASLSGTNVEVDFVEAPSQMLEEWVADPSILTLLSGHYITGEPIPKELLDKVLAKNDFGYARSTLRQIVFGLYDQALHGEKPPADANELFQALNEEISGIPRVEGINFPASFGHMMGGYDATYYGYMFSKAFALDMFTRFKVEGLRNPKTGSDYRGAILSTGGMKPAPEMMKQFLGRSTNRKAFYESLHLEGVGSGGPLFQWCQRRLKEF